MTDSWLIVPKICPICGWPAAADPFVDSHAGPGWACILDPAHFWQVRTARLRRLVTESSPNPYPWRDTADIMAWFQSRREEVVA